MMAHSGNPTLEPGTTLGWHIRRTLELALPIIVARAAFLVMALVDTLMTGWVSARELAYLGLGLSSQIFLMLIGIGALQAVAVLVAQAVGRGKAGECGAVLRAGLVHGGLYGLLIMAASGLAGPFFLAIGEEPGLAHGASQVAGAFAWGMPALLMFTACNYALEATGRPQIGMAIMIGVNILNIPLNGIFALGWGGLVEPMGATGAVDTSSALRWVGLLAILAFYRFDLTRHGDPYRIAVARPFRTAFAEAIGPIGRRLIRIGLPMGLAQGIESGAFASMTMIAGLIGAAGLAIHHITMTLTSLVYMMALGMMAATAIRVGNAVGRGDRTGIVRAGWTGIGLGAVVALVPTAIFLAFPTALAGVFTKDPAVLAYAETTLRVAGLMLVFDAMMGISIGALRGAGDVWPAFFFQIAAFWGLSIPLAWYLAIGLGTGPAGLIGGIFAGVVLSLSMLAPRFRIISRRPIDRI